MAQAQIVAWVTAIIAGLAFGSTIALWLIKRELGRIVSVVDRIPPKEWFDKVERALPDPARLEAHFQTVHEHSNRLTEHDYRLRSIEKAGRT
jgi:hypothetical protein